MRKAVFLDRDGTIAKDVSYCRRPEDFELLPGATEGIRLLNENGYKVIIITNQSGIGRGYFTEVVLKDIHKKMMAVLAVSGAYIDDIYYCPHLPEDDCDCRKPKPGMVIKAVREHDINIAESYFIGDKIQDIETGQAIACRTVLISSPAEVGISPPDIFVQPDHVASNLVQASRWIIERGKG